MILFFSLACYSSETYTVTVGKRRSEERTDAEEQVSVDVPEPVLDSEAVAEILNAVFSHGVVEPVVARDAYIWLQAQGDLECPGDSPFQLMGIIEPCTSDSGYTYSGMSIMRGATGYLSFPDSFSLLGDFYIIDPQGDRFVGAGELKYGSWGDRITGGVRVISEGIWSHPGEDTWVGTENSVWLEAVVSWTNTTQDWYVMLDGGTTLNGTSVHYDAVLFTKDCPAGTGTIGLRGDDGYWYDVRLKNDCSGCGRVFHDDVRLGEACLDTVDFAGDFFTNYHPELNDGR